MVESSTGVRALRRLGDGLLHRRRDGVERRAHHGGHLPPSAARMHLGQGVGLQARRPRLEEAPRGKEGQAQPDDRQPAPEGDSRWVV